MKVLWVHTFNPHAMSSGNFMFNFLDSFRAYCPEISVELFYFDKSGVASALRSLRFLVRRASEFDVVHFQYGSICSFFGFFLDHPAKVVTLRGSDWHSLLLGGSRLERIHSRLSGLLSRFSIPRMAMVIAVSERIAREVSFRSGVVARVVIDPINSLFFEGNRESVVRSNDSYRVILNSIDLSNPIKNLSFAERVVERCQRKFGVDIEIVRVHNLSQEDVRRLLLSGDCLLLTSEYEGWPNCVKEALVCGLSVVASDVSDLSMWAERIDTLRCVGEFDEELFARELYNALRTGKANNSCSTEIFHEFSGAYASSRLASCYRSILALESP